MKGTSINSSRSSLSWILKSVLVVGFFVLVTRLFELQVIKGAYFRSLSENNRLRTVTIDAPRGKILARGGEIIADNKPVNKTVTFEKQNGYTKEIAPANTPTDEILTEWERTYPMASASAQISGYLSEVSSVNVGKVDPHCPDKLVKNLGSLEGTGGIEEEYDCNLRGINGEEMVEVDISGHKLRTMGRKPATPGQDVQTTIDYGLQKKTAQEMEGKVGAVVVTDTRGQILTLYSSPSFDPNLFINQKSGNGVTKLISDPKLPLFNRTISGAYHPGSIFKLVVGAAALNDATIAADTTFKDTGVLSVNGFNYSTWYFTQYGRVEGEQTFAKALSRSTDTFFYQVGAKEGIDRLVYWADLFGLGKKTGLDIPGETAGILPSPAWKISTLGERWYLGNTYHFSIGQGDLLVTPLQANLWTSVFANGGEYCKPYLSLTGGHESCVSLNLANSTISEVRKGMEMACETGGTAFPFFDFDPKVACKTGTAETGPNTKTHAWFTVYAPLENPEIAVTVLIENGGEGSEIAAPVAKNILNYWFHERTGG